MNEYIDVRGPNPVYFNGMIAVELVGFTRDVTLQVARLWIAEKQGRLVDTQSEL